MNDTVRNVKKLFLNARYMVPIAVLLLLINFFVVSIFASSTTSMYLTPSQASVEKDKNISVNVRLNPGGEQISVIGTRLQYDTSKLQFVGISSSGSAFSSQITASESGGTVAIDRFISGGSYVSSDSFISQVTFKALASSGTTNLTLTGESNAYSIETETDVLSGREGAAITFTAPQTAAPTPTPTPAPAPTPTPTPASTPTNNTPRQSTSTPATPVSQTDTTTPKPEVVDTRTEIEKTQFTDNVESVAVEQKHLSFSVTVLAKKGASYKISYGEDKDSLTTAVEAVAEGPGAITVPMTSERLVPGRIYYYQIEVTDENGTTRSEVSRVKLKGYTLTLFIEDAEGNALVNSKVTLYSEPQEGETNDEGFVTFTDLEPGEHELVYQVGDTSYSELVYVTDSIATSADQDDITTNFDPAAQTAFVTLQDLKGQSIVFYLAIIGVAVVIAVAVVLFVLNKRGRGGGMMRSAQENSNVVKESGDNLPTGLRINPSDEKTPGEVITPQEGSSSVDA